MNWPSYAQAAKEETENYIKVDLETLSKLHEKMLERRAEADCDMVAKAMGLPSKEDKEEKRIARLVREQTRKIVFDELGMSKEALTQQIATLCDKLVGAHVKAMLETTQLKQLVQDSVTRAVKQVVENMAPTLMTEIMQAKITYHIPDANLRGLIEAKIEEVAKLKADLVCNTYRAQALLSQMTQRIEEEAAAKAAEAAEEFIKNNLKISISGRGESNDGKRKIIS